MGKWVYGFGNGKADGRAAMKELLGGKGANLAEMSKIGLPVPSGFTISTEVCAHFTSNANLYPEDLDGQVGAAMKRMEGEVGAALGDVENPLLVSVRSGARASMPGMMDTVLNLGLNDQTVEGLARRADDARFAYDSYRRFIQMYANVVMGVDHGMFESTLELLKEAKGIELDTELEAGDWQEIIKSYKEIVVDELGTAFPQDPTEQLWGAIGAVFKSWMNQRAITYRRLQRIPESWGTAVNVQAMVFGNMGDDCATGVAFTRNPATGENFIYGEFLINAQGEDVVAGIRTPQNISIAEKQAEHSELPAMEEAMPELYRELLGVRDTLEAHYREMQDIEFTVQQGKLYVLQTRSGKRTATAAVRIAVELAADGTISEADAVMRVDPAQLDQLLHPMLDPDAKKNVLARGLPASPGAASGKIVFNADEAEAAAQAGEKVILVRAETSPEDIHGMHAASAILTTRGGMTSHAAVVARGMGRPCVVGAGELSVDVSAGILKKGTSILERGDVITVDGGTGEIMSGAVPTVTPELSGEFDRLMEWADKYRRMGVRTNAEVLEDAQTALNFGAEGIGLCRTEHMFFDPQRIAAVRQMIMAEDETGRRAALAELLPFQRDDFSALFKVMNGLPVTIRLLDPPLHEFLPRTEEEILQVASLVGAEPEAMRQRLVALHETNPMLGHRGCRLGITYPEIYEMQARAIFEAAALAEADTGRPVNLEIMIPLVSTKAELDILKSVIDRAAVAVAEEVGTKVDYQVGTMIELPRAALIAGKLAETATFFSFGTNDLTQTTFGLSRDDAGSFLGEYQRLGILSDDPFATLDIDGVGELVAIAAERGRETRPDLKLGICGEHGGDPRSIEFCETVGLDYVSCSPYRVPIARLAAAQAAISNTKVRDAAAAE
ncbi:MAG: pyruvate, phosphate dikinase [Alphaproteobacteria bacterium]|nr:pyruvate, phosphate dikinase [Alphaproteobacteria bacterium]